jgi:small subunit ribosomal protein S1
MNTFSSMLEDYFEENEEIKNGAIISPVIVGISHNSLIVDLNYKAEGMVSIKEVIETDAENGYSVGDTISLLVETTDDGFGTPILSYNKASKILNYELVEKSLNETHFIEVFVEKETNRGLVANFKGIECFIPFVLCDTKKKSSYSELIGQRIFVKIIKVKGRNNIIASHKYFLEFQNGIDKKEIFKEIKESQEIMVTVKNVTSYGAFVTYKNIDSLLYVKDFSWFNTVDSKQVYQSGDEIKVLVTKIDLEQERIYISVKDLDESPWVNILNEYEEGDQITAEISDLNRHGLFIRYNNEIDFFIHRKNLNYFDGDIEDNFEIGQKISSRIREIDYEKRILKLLEN